MLFIKDMSKRKGYRKFESKNVRKDMLDKY